MAVNQASSQLIKHAKSLYQFIVPVTQLNLSKEQSDDYNLQKTLQQQGISPVNRGLGV